MFDPVGKLVTNIRMHTPYHVRGLGGVPSTIDINWRRGLVMTKTQTGVWCTAPGDDNKLYGFFIPDTNCIGITISPNASVVE